MNDLHGLDALLWDFDGVILDSNAVRELGFSLVLKDYPDHEVEDLLQFHRKNGGLSRYVKFRHFFEVIRKETCTDVMIEELTNDFSSFMRKELVKKDNLIRETVAFIEAYSSDLPMHIVSGSDGQELRFLCKELGLSSHFRTIEGSPTPKTDLVSGILMEYGYAKEKCLLIGDSINDFDAASANGILFMAYNNPDLNQLTQLNLPIQGKA